MLKVNKFPIILILYQTPFAEAESSFMINETALQVNVMFRNIMENIMPDDNSFIFFKINLTSESVLVICSRKVKTQ
jgi:hypothetical protein